MYKEDFSLWSKLFGGTKEEYSEEKNPFTILLKLRSETPEVNKKAFDDRLHTMAVDLIPTLSARYANFSFDCFCSKALELCNTITAAVKPSTTSASP